MNKKLLGVALSAIIAVSAAQAGFDGGSIGANVGYSWTSASIKGNTSGKVSLHPTSFIGGLKAGYMRKLDSIYVGGDFRGIIGLGGSEDEKDTTLNGTAAKASVEESWVAGAGLSVGTELSSNWLGFVRLGLDYTEYKTGATAAASGINGRKFNTWSVVPGLGVKMNLNNTWSVDAVYEYSYAFRATNISGTAKASPKPTSSAVKLGISYHL